MDKEISEIAVLTERISKDPKSKLFVPLAEEYKKAGDIEMATYVLLEGLKNNPDYVTARTSLGKLLLVKGDLAGAQKEFELVVKSIPDNLMAQKKLGDLFILQNSQHDALAHYKIALSLNPADGALAALILDVEAGQDVRSKIQLSKAKTVAEQVVKKEPPASTAAGKPARESVFPQASKVEPIKPVEFHPVSQTVSPAPDAGSSYAPASSVTEPDEPDEVLVVESLEQETSVLEPHTAGIDLPVGKKPESMPSVAAENDFGSDVSASSHARDESAVSEVIRPENEQFNIEETDTISPGISEKPALDEFVEAEIIEAVPEKAGEQSFDDISEKSDDFTTDTLAELYISQGFFEKAIEIYERMLADKPDSRGLMDKLAWVRAEAAQAAAPAAERKKVPEVPGDRVVREYIPVAEAREYVPTVESEEITIEAEVLTEPGELMPEKPSRVEPFFAEAGEFKPLTGPEKQPTAGGVAGFDVLTAHSVQEQARLRPQFTDFEPREYVPPAAERELVKPAAEKVSATTTPGIARRKETIARLETWLFTIKKEK